MDDRILTPVQARIVLNEIGNWDAKRDRIIRETHAAGVPVAEISRTLGIARSTITRVLAAQEHTP